MHVIYRYNIGGTATFSISHTRIYRSVVLRGWWAGDVGRVAKTVAKQENWHRKRKARCEGESACTRTLYRGAFCRIPFDWGKCVNNIGAIRSGDEQIHLFSDIYRGYASVNAWLVSVCVFLWATPPPNPPPYVITATTPSSGAASSSTYLAAPALYSVHVFCGNPRKGLRGGSQVWRGECVCEGVKAHV